MGSGQSMEKLLRLIVFFLLILSGISCSLYEDVARQSGAEGLEPIELFQRMSGAMECQTGGSQTPSPDLRSVPDKTSHEDPYWWIILERFLRVAGFLLTLASFILALTQRGRKLAKEMASKSVAYLTGQSPRHTPEKVPDPTPVPILVGISGHFAGTKINIGKEPLAIGRDRRACGLVFPKSVVSISKRHCVISYDAERKAFMIEDCWSLNGTFRNSGEKIEPGEPYVLQSDEGFYLAQPENLFTVRLVRSCS